VAAIRRRATLDIVIHLHPYRPNVEEERTGIPPDCVDVLGIQFPVYSLPVSSGRNMANIIEAAALNYKLKLLGHDAAKELDEKISGSFLRKAGK
jgi:HPr kinase/phosphorylase